MAPRQKPERPAGLARLTHTAARRLASGPVKKSRRLRPQPARAGPTRVRELLYTTRAVSLHTPLTSARHRRRTRRRALLGRERDARAAAAVAAPPTRPPHRAVADGGRVAAGRVQRNNLNRAERCPHPYVAERIVHICSDVRSGVAPVARSHAHGLSQGPIQRPTPIRLGRPAVAAAREGALV